MRCGAVQGFSNGPLEVLESNPKSSKGGTKVYFHLAGKTNMENFVQKPDNDSWKEVLLLYSKALSLKAQKMKADKKKDLLALDKW